MMQPSRQAAQAALLAIASFATLVQGHDHHEGGESHIPEGEAISLEPIVSRSLFEERDERNSESN
jgi:hypothetical protein